MVNRNTFSISMRRVCPYLVVAALVLFLGLLVYQDFVLGGGYDYLFDGGMSDSVRILYPSYYWLYETLFEGNFSFWSLQMAMGTSLFSHADIVFNPLTYVLYLFGKAHIEDMFIWMLLSGMVLSGLSCCCYLGSFRMSVPSRVLASIVFASCAWTGLFGSNLPWLIIMTYFPLFLKGIELLIRRDRIWLLSLMTFLLALWSYYFLWMACLGGLVYAFARMLWTRTLGLRLVVKGLLGVLLPMACACFWLAPSIQLALSSERVGEKASILQLLVPDVRGFLTWIARMFGNDTLGMMNEYGGASDYFNHASYTTLLPIAMTPQLLAFSDKRERRWLVAAFATMVVSISFPIISFVMNGMSDVTTRWTFVWVPVVALVLGISVDSVLRNGGVSWKASLGSLSLLCAIACVATVALPVVGTDGIVQRIGRVAFSVGVCVMYLLVFDVLAHKLNGKSLNIAKMQPGVLLHVALLSGSVGVLLAGDVCMNYRHWPNRSSYSAEFSDMADSGSGFFDQDMDAVRTIQESDSTWYRIEKSHGSVNVDQGIIYESDNDAMVQGYFGLHGYNSLNSSSAIRFLQNAGIWVVFPHPDERVYQGQFGDPKNVTGQNLNYINGVGDRFGLMSVLGVKYYITCRDEQIDLPSYFKERADLSTDDRVVWENEAAFPFASLHTKCVGTDLYDSLQEEEKDIILGSSVVLEDGSPLLEVLPRLEEDSRSLVQMAEAQHSSVETKMYDQGSYSFLTDSEEDGVLVIATAYEEGNWAATVDGEPAAVEEVDCGLIGISVPEGNHEVTLRYFPLWMRRGAVVSLASAMTCAVACGARFCWLRRRREEQEISTKVNSIGK